MTNQSLLLPACYIIMSFSYSDSSTSDNRFYLIGDFFQTDFVGVVPELYILHCLLHNETVVLEFFYKTMSIAYSLGNIHK